MAGYLEELLGDGHHAPLRHARPAHRPAVLQEQHGILCDVEVGIVDARGEIIVVLSRTMICHDDTS